MAAEEEAEVGRSIEQEFQPKQTMQRNKTNKYEVVDHTTDWC